MTPDVPVASLTGLAVSGRPATKRQGDLTEEIARVAAASPAAAPAPDSAPDEAPPRAEEIVVYWERLRRGRPLPPLADLDRGLVAKGWPDSLIVVFDRDPGAMPRIQRLGAADGAVEYTPMVTDWILTSARHAARRAERRDETRDFFLGGDHPRYRLFLLPLGSGAEAGDGVLCHLCRVA
jgi:hypothetical protein